MTRAARVRLADDLYVSLDIFATTSGIIGIKGSGKTNDGVVLAEQAVKFGVPVVAIDPTSVWWGLKSSADGRSPGLPFYVFGGSHGDVPLEPEAGPVLARFVVDYQVPTILDVSDFSKRMRRRFVGEFCEQLYELKNRRRDPLFLIIDEIKEYAPQNIIKGDPYLTMCLGAVEDIASMGRSRGIGLAFIGQRPATINNNVLTQADNIFAMRTIGTADRKALDLWVTESQGDVQLRDEMFKQLASLKDGRGYFWSPAVFNEFKCVQFAARETFDSSQTPRPGKKRIEPRVFAAVDLAKLRGEIAESVERKKADDPKELRAQIARLNHELEIAHASLQAEPVEIVKEVPMPVLTDEDRRLLHSVIESFEKRRALASGIATEAGRMIVERISELLAMPNDGLLQIAKRLEDVTARVVSSNSSAPTPPPVKKKTGTLTGSAPHTTVAASSAKLGKGERLMMIAIAQYPNGAMRDQLTVLTGYKATSRNEYIRRLVNAGYAAQHSDAIVPTKAGIAALGSDYEPLPTGSALRHYWLQRLGGGEAALFRVITEAYPRAVTREHLSEVTGYKATSRNEYIRRLAARRLVVVMSDGVRASDTLFDKAR